MSDTQSAASAAQKPYDPAAARLAELQASLAAKAGQTTQVAPPAPPAAPAAPTTSATPQRPNLQSAGQAPAASEWGDGSDGSEAKQREAFVRLEPFPATDTYAVTLVAAKFLPRYEDTYKGVTKIVEAWELIFGAKLPSGKYAFIKPWPFKNSLDERSGFAKMFRAFAGHQPVPGAAKPAVIMGKTALLRIEAGQKTSPKGTVYLTNKAGDFSSLPSMMAALATPRAELLPQLQAQLAASSQPRHQSQGSAQPTGRTDKPAVPEDDVPF